MHIDKGDADQRSQHETGDGTDEGKKNRQPRNNSERNGIRNGKDRKCRHIKHRFYENDGDVAARPTVEHAADPVDDVCGFLLASFRGSGEPV